MSKNVLVGIGLLILGLVCVSFAISVPPPAPPVVGADGTSAPVAALPWGQLITMLLSVFGGGSLFASIKAFWAKAEPFVTPILHQVTPSVPVPIPVSPVVVPKPIEDGIELLQAAIAYAAKRGDKAALLRLALAAATELNDVIGKSSPDVAAELNGLATALVNDLVPSPAVAALKGASV